VDSRLSFSVRRLATGGRLYSLHPRLIRHDVYSQPKKIPDFFPSSVRCFVKSSTVRCARATHNNRDVIFTNGFYLGGWFSFSREHYMHYMLYPLEREL
jgi:hypothetical protein